MANEIQEIYVYMDTEGTPILMGRLYYANERGSGISSFEYAASWLAGVNDTITLDPDLALYAGRQYISGDKGSFGIFADSSPDRWGRILMNRRETIAARKENRKPRRLTGMDYLLGVYDESRMGALRFALSEGGSFLANDSELAAPPWTSLRKLETAALAFEKDENGAAEKWLKQLLALGSSLGGARPKANVVDIDGNLWIAKFPSKHDTYDSGKWEMVIHDLAEACGLNVPEAKLEKFSEMGSTFLVKRFDRDDGKRIHFASAMTLLGKTDGQSDDTSYLDIASFIKANGSSPKEDLLELWKRVVFSMAVSNTDDHLRNHGFILDKKGWRLSPMYDVNPNIYGESLSLNVSEYDSTIDLQLAIDTAVYYGISNKTAKAEAANIVNVVNENWKVFAKKRGVNRGTIEYMSPAFSLRV